MTASTDLGLRESHHGDNWHSLSAIQRNLWFLYRLHPEWQGNFNLLFVARARPALDASRLQEALNRLAARHPMLRARFAERDGQPVQCVLDTVSVPVDVIEVGELDDEAVARRVMRDRSRPFDLFAGPAIRARLYRTPAAGECVVSLVVDHLVFDGWSLWQLTRELGEELERPASSTASDGARAASGPTFLEHVAQQREWLASPRAQRQLAYWRAALADDYPPLELRPDLRGEDRAGGDPREAITTVLPADLAHGLRELATRNGATLSDALLAGYFLLLHRVTGQDRVAVGSPMPGRGRAWKRTIGNFINPVVLRSMVKPGLTVAELVKVTHSTATKGLRNQDYPLTELVERLNPRRSADQQPYYQALYVFQKAREAAEMTAVLTSSTGFGPVGWGGVQLEPFGRFESFGAAGLDLVMEALELEDRIWTCWDFDATKFRRSTIQRFVDCWITLLRGMVAADGREVMKLPLLGEAERWQVVEGWSGKREGLGSGRCVHELIEEVARREPEKVAVWAAG
ncbi:MAG TPA: condensation domain-containing protein, partial [Polyangia bacterium]|nr:condensation domain-containing protein [Polyangia bacterium]